MRGNITPAWRCGFIETSAGFRKDETATVVAAGNKTLKVQRADGSESAIPLDQEYWRGKNAAKFMQHHRD